jgi:hypothetical protein
VELEMKMTSNYTQAWKDLPFNNIVHLVAYSNKNLAEISRKKLQNQILHQLNIKKKIDKYNFEK